MGPITAHIILKIEKFQDSLYYTVMRILAIETSCDDTGIAVLEIVGVVGGRTSHNFKVLSNVVSSQDIHQNYGGVFPMMAKREHQRNLVPVLEQALKEAKLLINQKSEIKNQNYNLKFKTIEKILEREPDLFARISPFLQSYGKPDVDVIAVTHGPGLEPCLWVGVNFARALSYFWDIPLLPVNHIEAHILVNFLKNKKYPFLNGRQKQGTLFPAVALVVSGGHTQLILVKGIGKYKIIGETRDDAAGECFDKCAKILGLGYPGGPVISKIASTVKGGIIHLPRPMINSKDYDFSFSGLKTAVLYKTRASKLTNDFVKNMAFEVQQAIVDVLIKKTIQAAKDFKVKTIILGGGVSANQELRDQMKTVAKKARINVVVPPRELSTDNAPMIAVAASFHKTKKQPWQKLRAEANLRVN